MAPHFQHKAAQSQRWFSCARHFSAPFYARLCVYLEKWLLVVFTLGEGWNITCLHELSPNIGLSSSENISVTISGSEDQSVFRSSDGLFMVIAEVKAVTLNTKCRGYATPEVFKTVIEVFRNKFTCKLVIIFFRFTQCWLVFVITH